MPELNFKGKEFVYNHHLTVPFRELEMQAHKGIGEPSLDGNLIIHGDNLHALKALMPTFAGKVDCIFIDPPYNTGNEGWAYNDNVNSPMIREWLNDNPIDVDDRLRHDKWACMMWPRLRLLHELLADHGTMWVTLDNNEIAVALQMLAQIFGRENILSVVTTEANPRGRQSDVKFATVHDYLICVAKNNEEYFLSGVIPDESYSNDFKHSDPDGKKWRELGLRQRGADSLREDREDMFFPIYASYENGSVSLEKTETHNVKIVPKKSDGRESRWSWSPEFVAEQITRVYSREVKGRAGVKRLDVFYKDYFERDGKDRRQKPKTIWPSTIANTESGGLELTNIFGEKAFSYPKPRSLIEKVMEIALRKNGLILDSFAGSGTTAHAVLAANKLDGGSRRFILVEGEGYADTLTAERVRRVINGYAFKGTQREELLREKITFTKLKKAETLLEEVQKIEMLHGPNFDRVKKEVKDGALIVTGERDCEETAPGLGGTFTYCTLGDPIDMDGLLTGEDLPELQPLAALLYHTATSQVFDASQLKAAPDIGEEVHRLGAANGRHLWLFYKPDLDWLKSGEAALTLSKARAIAATDDGEHLVFSPAKFVSRDLLKSQNIRVEYAPLPYALYRVETA